MKIKSLLILSLLLLLLPSVSYAQLADGYYRVMNLGLKTRGAMTEDLDVVKGEFYTYVADGTIQTVSTNSTRQTFEALQLREGLANALYDPQSVIYIKKKGSYYDLEAQGTSVSKITSFNLTLTSTGLANTVKLSTVASGMTVFLTTTTDIADDHLKAKTIASPSNTDYFTYWTVVPVTTTSGNFVGVKPRLTAGGKHYAPYYASYPFKLASAGMKAYYVKNVTDKTYELQEFASGAVIPGGTPVIIECSSTNVADNKLELLYGDYTAVSGNKLSGVYFYNQYLTNSPTARTQFNASTMRVWAVQNDKLVLVNTPTGLPQSSANVAYLPANESYLPVASTTAAMLTDAADVPPVPKHTITFDTDGGTVISPITAEEGSAITAPTNPTKTGYTFTGWNPAVPASMPTNDLTVKAQWQVNKYKVKYVVDGVTVKEEDLDYGSTITPPTNPTKTGYTFTGWDNSATVVPANDVTFTAQWQVNQYKVKYVVDGVTVKEETLDYGTTITPPATNPTKTGYKFIGWDNTSTVVPASDVTFTAQWQVNQYKVKYVVDGETVKEETLDYGATITPATDPSKTGYKFTGWDNTATVVPANDVTFTAQWQVNQYKVKFVVDGVTVKEENLDYGSTITPPATDPSKTGYTFTGWDNSATVVPANDVTFTAQWQINKYKVKFIVDGVTVKEEDLDYGSTITPPATDPTKTGADFLGWSPDPATIATVPDKDVEFVATFSTNDYTITFDTDGGSAIDPITAQYGTSVTTPSDPTKTGYTFKGWEPEVPATIPAGDLTVKAQWTVNKYTVYFTGICTEDCESEQFDYNSEVKVQANPTRPNYTFDGWDGLLPVMPAHDVTVKAKWKLKEETVDIPLAAGWNWVALSVSNDNQANINTALASCNWTSDDVVKNADKYASYSAKYNKWVGTFTSADAINPTAMYKVYSKNAQTLKVEGKAIDPELTPITVNPNWNYIGYFNGAASEIYVAEALDKYAAEKGDIIKSQTQMATYDGAAWQGDLTVLKRGQGYMLFRSAEAQQTTFKFPTTATPVANGAKATVPALFASNMNIIAAVDGIAATEGDEVVAVVNGEVRGAAAVNAEGKALLTVQGEASDNITFVLQRNGEMLAAAKANIAFAEDAIIGSLDNPTAITFVSQDADNAVLGDVQAIYNAAGALLPTTDFGALPKGAYIVTSVVDGKTVVTKVTK